MKAAGLKLGVGLAVALVASLPAAPLSRVVAQEATQDCAAPNLEEDLSETGLQGQVPKVDQDSGRSRLGYCKGLRLVGQNDIEMRGGNFQMAWVGDCAYVDQLWVPEYPLRGMAVIDAHDPRNPELVSIIPGPPGSFAGDSIEANKRRGMIVRLNWNFHDGNIAAGTTFDIYDASADCRKPVYKGTYDGAPAEFHGLRISADGRTVWVTDCCVSATRPNFRSGPTLHAIDVSDMANPKLIATWDPEIDGAGGGSYGAGAHDLDVNRAGTRAYLGTYKPASVILDTSEVQQRHSNPKIKYISEIAEGNTAHTAMVGHIRGQTYLFSNNESPSIGGTTTSCPGSWMRISDITNEQKPRTVSEYPLEVNLPHNCDETRDDGAGYSTHYGGLDSVKSTKLVFYAYFDSGLRVFDVRDPRRPREIAYYNPPPKNPLFPGAFGKPGVFDDTASDVRYRAKTGHIWFASAQNGFQIVELTREAR